jgi:hypothetical protein
VGVSPDRYGIYAWWVFCGYKEKEGSDVEEIGTTLRKFSVTCSNGSIIAATNGPEVLANDLQTILVMRGPQTLPKVEIYGRSYSTNITLAIGRVDEMPYT